MLNFPPLLLLLTTLFWAGNAVVGKIALGYMSSIELSFWRWVLALVLLTPFAYKSVCRDFAYYKSHPGLILFLAVLSVTFYNTFQYLALQWTMAINIGVISATMPLAVFTLTWIFGQERANGQQKLGLMIAILGVLYVIVKGDLQQLLSLSFNQGDLLMLLAVLSFAVYSVYMKRLPLGLDKLGLLWVLILLGALGILPLYLWDIQQHQLLEISLDTLLILGYVSVFPSLLSYYFWNKAVMMAGANMAGLYFNMIAVFASLLAIVFLDEPFSLHHVIGMTAIFFGILLSTYLARGRGVG